MERIYEMKLHGRIKLAEDLFVIRVPGGWIYERKIGVNWKSVFVPFDNEFLIVDLPKQ